MNLRNIIILITFLIISVILLSISIASTVIGFTTNVSNTTTDLVALKDCSYKADYLKGVGISGLVVFILIIGSFIIYAVNFSIDLTGCAKFCICIGIVYVVYFMVGMSFASLTIFGNSIHPGCSILNNCPSPSSTSSSNSNNNNGNGNDINPGLPYCPEAVNMVYADFIICIFMMIGTIAFGCAGGCSIDFRRERYLVN